MKRKKKGNDRQPQDTVVDFSATLSVILDHLDESLCEEVFDEVRDKERQREWTLFLLAKFWIAVVLEAPPALSHVLAVPPRALRVDSLRTPGVICGERPVRLLASAKSTPVFCR